MDEYKNLVNQKTSALSSLGNANRQALKYADNTALAQGYATQGARLQNMGNLQNAYLNQVGGVNQQFQQQLGSLENTASKEALNNYQVNVENAIANNTLTNEELSKLQNAYFGRLSSTDITEAENYTRQALGLLNTASENQQFIDTYGVNTSEQEGYSVEALLNADGKARKIIGQGAGGKKYLDGLQEILENNELKNGDTIKVKNNYYVYRDGKIYQANNKIENPTYVAEKNKGADITTVDNTSPEIAVNKYTTDLYVGKTIYYQGQIYTIEKLDSGEIVAKDVNGKILPKK